MAEEEIKKEKKAKKEKKTKKIKVKIPLTPTQIAFIILDYHLHLKTGYLLLFPIFHSIAEADMKHHLHT